MENEIKQQENAKRSIGVRPRQSIILKLLARRVRHLRGELAISRKSLAQKSGLSERFLAQLEGGEGNISLANLEILAAALEVSPTGLIDPQLRETPSGDHSVRQMRLEMASFIERADQATLEKMSALLRSSGFLNSGLKPDARPVIALVGLRGAGKSTVGPLLAEALELPFHELDDIIQDLTGLALGEIYELHGEQYYRSTEALALKNLVERNQPVVVAVSGGIVNHAPSLSLLRDQTRWIWLRADPALHMERVLAQGDQRPMQNRPNAMAELKQLIEFRRPLYRQAHWTLDTSELTPEVCADELARAILDGRL